MFAKRLFDVSASFFGLIFFSPLFLLITILIKVRMPGPVLFIQNRVGRDAKLFRMVKFRTMNVNHSGNSVSIKGDARITPLGALLRKYKLDELPELWNVFIGDMSFVGPRPDVPGYADKLRGEDRLMLSIRPGITGPASLKYRNEEEILVLQPDPLKYNNNVIFPDKVRINLAYLEHQTFWLDLKIIFLTLLGKKLKEQWAQ